ncbi:MAG: DNA mismatch repair protein MutS, partial [Planctomycetota bacterium]|nr:DNA mismatch repair protein MutS [Planctomycetota bacterium]
MTRPDPHTLYTEALTRHQAVAAEADRLGRRLADLRTVAFFSALGLLGAALWGGLTPHAIWLPFAAFVWLVILHGRATAREVGARRAAAFHEAGLRRLNGTWAGTGRTGAGLAAADHPYAADLDILGRGSLFELICTARTRAGEQRLAEFLLSPAAPALVRARQAAVAELAPRLGLREALAVEEGDAGDALTRGTCAAWGAGPRRLAGTVEPYVHALAAAASTVLLVAWLFFDGRGAPMLAAMLLQFVLAARRRQAVTDVLEAADRPAQDLALLGHLLEHLERAEFESPHLRARVQALATDGRPPSRRIATLARLMDFVDARRNQLVLPIAWLLSSGTLLAYRIEAWRAENGPVLADWLDALAEVEALACLAAHTCDHPEDPFPTLLEDEGPRLEARAIAHPLLPRDQAVPNDVTLAIGAEDTPQALLVSGSNMSGKS